MKAIATLAAALTLVGGCHRADPGAAAPKTGEAGPPASAFDIGVLSESDINIQGCTTTLVRAGGADTVFAEDGADVGARGFIRLDGRLISVGLTGASGDNRRATRNFANPDQSVAIVESLTTGAAHEDSDSVEQSGTIAVTYRGATQTVQVDGGTAC
jgi:hypothetical protein